MVVHNGNVVNYGSGGRWYVQVEVWDNGAGPGPQCTVYYSFRVITNTTMSDNSNTMQWTDPWGSGTTTVNIQHGSGGGTSYVVGQATNAGLANISYGTNNQLYFRLYVTGLASGGTGPSAVEFYYSLPARTASPPNAPTAAVIGITATSALPYVATAGGDNGAVADAVNYRISRVSDGAHMGDKQAGYGGVHFTNLSRATQYNAYAQVHNAAGWGPWSAAVGFTTLATVPDAPGVLTASGITQNYADVNWVTPYNGGSALTGFHIQVDDDAGFSSPVLDANSPATHVSRAVLGLTLNTQYYARVRTWNANGYSGWSPTLAFKTAPGLPGAPPEPTLAGVSGVELTVNWVAPVVNGSPVTGYQIQVDDDGDMSSPVSDTTVGAAVLTKTVASLIPNTVYYIRVRANSALGYGPWSTIVSARTTAGFFITVGGAPKTAVVYVSVGGVPKLADVYLTIDGTPRLI